MEEATTIGAGMSDYIRKLEEMANTTRVVPRMCKDCLFFKKSFVGWEFSHCTYPGGVESATYCSSARNEYGHCKPEGIHYYSRKKILPKIWNRITQWVGNKINKLRRKQ